MWTDRTPSWVVAATLVLVGSPAAPAQTNGGHGQSADADGEPTRIVLRGESDSAGDLELTMRNVRLDSALDHLRETSPVRLAYSRDRVPASRRTSLHVSEASPGAVLAAIADSFGLRLRKTVTGQYVMSRHSAPEEENRDAERQGAVTGRVVDAQGNPVSGASVSLAGTEYGTLTGDDGRFRIADVPPGDYTVRVQVIGYDRATRRVTVSDGESTSVEFTLQVSAVSMDRLVVTATGTNRMREVGNAVGQIDAASEVEQAQSPSVGDLLTGRISNVTVQQNTGSVGAAASITVRGAGSLSLSNRPIMYVDGVRIRTEGLEGGVRGQEYSRLADISPENIESIDVVKGPAAATLYGTEASGGVIRISTKRGQAQETRYSLSVDYGGLRDNTEYEPTMWNPRSLLGTAAEDTVYSMNLLETESPFRTGQIHSFQGNARGGGDVVRFFATGEWSQEQGYVPTNSTEKLQARTNFTLTPTSDLEATFTNGLTVGTTRLPEANNSPYGWVALSYIGFPFYKHIEHGDPNGLGDGGLIETCPLNVEIARLTGAPLSALGRDGCEAGPGFAGRTFGDLETIDNRRESNRYVGSASVRWSPVDFWNTRATVGYDLFSERIRSLFPVDPERPFGERSTGELSKRKIDGQNFTAELTTTVDYGLADGLSAHTSVGAQYFQEMTDGDSIVAKQFPAGSPSASNAAVRSTGDFFTETRTIGLFAEQRFSVHDRVFVTPAVRFDDNSAFGQELGIKTYPRLSASWVASEEPWFPGGAVSQLRLRGAWGKSGRQPGSFHALSLLSPMPVVRDGQSVLGVRPNRLGNSGLKPETSTGLEAGFTAGLWDERLSVDFTYYHQRTEDALVQRPLAPSRGYLQARWFNLAELENSGVEVSADATVLDAEDVGLDLNAQFSTSNSEITRLPEPIVVDGGQEHREGRPFGAFYGHPMSVQGDSVVIGDSQMLGVSEPKWNGSLRTSLRLVDDRVRLYGMLDATGDFMRYMAGQRLRCRLLGGGTYGGVCPDIHRREADGSFTDEARIKQAATGQSSLVLRSPWIEDATFAKLRTVGVSIQLPRRWFRVVEARSVSLRLNAHNLKTWTDFPGLDPEMSLSGAEGRLGGNQGFDIPPGLRGVASLSIEF